MVKRTLGKLEIGVVVVLLGNRDSSTDINDRGSRRLVEITMGAIRE